MTLVPARSNYGRNHAALACALLTAFLCGCGKPPVEAPPQQTPPAAVRPSPTAAAPPQQQGPGEGLSAVAVRILRAAHRSGGIVLSGACAGPGIGERYTMPRPARTEPMEQAFQEISARYQNVYWRESQATGVRLVDSAVKARLLNLRIREFRVVEDLEPDAVMAVLWRQPEVRSFLRRNHAAFARRPYGARKVLSPPMVLELKNRTVAEVLDRIAAAYHQDPPKVWLYQECDEKGTTLIDVRMP